MSHVDTTQHACLADHACSSITYLPVSFISQTGNGYLLAAHLKASHGMESQALAKSKHTNNAHFCKLFHDNLVYSIYKVYFPQPSMVSR